MKKYEMNENWELEEVEDLNNLFIVLVKHGSFDSGYTEAYGTDNLEMKAAFDALTKQYEDIGCDELTHIYLIQVPNTKQVVSMVEPTLYGKLNGNTSDPTMLSLLSDIYNRADCEQLASWAGAGLTEAKKRKKKNDGYLSGTWETITTGDPDLNIKHFNRCNGTDFEDQAKAEHAAEQAAENAAEAVADGSSAGASGASEAGSESAGGEATGGEGMGESLNEETLTEKLPHELGQALRYSYGVGVYRHPDIDWERSDIQEISQEEAVEQYEKGNGKNIIAIQHIKSTDLPQKDGWEIAVDRQPQLTGWRWHDLNTGEFDGKCYLVANEVKNPNAYRANSTLWWDYPNVDSDKILPGGDTGDHRDRFAPISYSKERIKDIKAGRYAPDYYAPLNRYNVSHKTLTANYIKLKTALNALHKAQAELNLKTQRAASDAGKKFDIKQAEKKDQKIASLEAKIKKLQDKLIELNNEKPSTMQDQVDDAQKSVDSAVNQVNDLLAEFGVRKPATEELEEAKAPVEIADMKSLIQEIIDKYNTEKTSKISLVDTDGNDTIEYHAAEGEEGQDGHVTEHFSFTVCGGMNGNGDWTNYFNDLSKVAKELKKATKWEPVAIDVNTDVPDDLFYVKFNLFNPAQPAKEALTEDLIVIEPFEAKEKLNKLVDQIKEQENDEVKQSLLTLLNVYLFQTVGPEDREDCNLTEEDWKEISDFAQKETDNYYKEHPEELPGAEEHAAEEGDAEGEEIEENLTEATLDYFTQKDKMYKLNNGTRGFNAKSASIEKLNYNRMVCQREHYDVALDVIEDELVDRNLLKREDTRRWKASHSQNNGVKVTAPQPTTARWSLTPDDFDVVEAKIIKACNSIDDIPGDQGQGNIDDVSLKNLFVYMVWAVMFKKLDLAAAIKQYIANNWWGDAYDAATIKAILQTCLTDQATITKITHVLNLLKEGLEKEPQDMTKLDENIELEEDKIFVGKLGQELDLPPEIKLLNKDIVEKAINDLEPEEQFIIGYVNPVYFYRALWEWLPIYKCTEMSGYTGVDFSQSKDDVWQDQKVRIDNAKKQIAAAKKFGQQVFVGANVDYASQNKLVRQYRDVKIDPNTQKTIKADQHNTILFYPEGSPTVCYWVKLPGSTEFLKITGQQLDKYIMDNLEKIEDQLNVSLGQAKDTVHKKLYQSDSWGNTIQDIDNATRDGTSFEKQSKRIHKYNDRVKVTVRALYTDQVYYLLTPKGQYGNRLVESLNEDIELQEAGKGIWLDNKFKSYRILYKKFEEKEYKPFKDVRRANDAIEVAKRLSAKDNVDSVMVVPAGATKRLIVFSLGRVIENNIKSFINDIKHAENPNFSELAGIDQEINGDFSRKTMSEDVELDEAKRYVKRYYVRPQNIFCSNKEDILQALLRVGDENCSIYSLKNLSDHEDVQELTPNDIIYYYDDHVLYDKNHVQVMDYDLFVKHEEERKKVANVDAISDSSFGDMYDDRITDDDLKDKEAIANFKAINKPEIKEDVELDEAYDFKVFSEDPERNIALEKSFNKAFLSNFISAGVIGRNLTLSGKYYSYNLNKNVPTTYSYKIDDVFVGSASGKLCIKSELGKALWNKSFFYAEDYFSNSLKIKGEKATWIKNDDIVDSAFEAWYSARKQAVADERSKEAKIKRRATYDAAAEKLTTGAAEVILNSQNCEELKAWLADNIEGILFTIPTCSDPNEVILDDTLSVDDFEKIIEKWQENENKFLGKWKPELIEGEDYTYRDAATDPESVSVWYKFRGLNCAITFKLPVEDPEVPAEVKDMIQAAKWESKDADPNRAINFEVQGKVLSSYYAGIALGKIFGQDGYLNISFYKKAAPQPEQEPDNPFEQEFDAVDAYGDKLESLTEDVKNRFTCCICGEECEGYGNNPAPYKEEGKCCDACNKKFVIPARLNANLEAASGEEDEPGN